MEKRLYLPILNAGLLRVSFDPIQFVLVTSEFDLSTPLGCMLTTFLKTSLFLYYLTVSSKTYSTSAFASVSADWPLPLRRILAILLIHFPFGKILFCISHSKLQNLNDKGTFDILTFLTLLFTMLLLCFKLHFLLASEMLLLLHLIL